MTCLSVEIFRSQKSAYKRQVSKIHPSVKRPDFYAVEQYATSEADKASLIHKQWKQRLYLFHSSFHMYKLYHATRAAVRFCNISISIITFFLVQQHLVQYFSVSWRVVDRIKIGIRFMVLNNAILTSLCRVLLMVLSHLEPLSLLSCLSPTLSKKMKGEYQNPYLFPSPIMKPSVYESVSVERTLYNFVANWQ